MSKIKVTRPVASVRGYGEDTMPICAIDNVRKSETGKSLCFDRVGQKDFNNGKIELGYASADQDAGKHNWFVDDKGNPVEAGKEAFLNEPKMLGLAKGRGVYA
jgi:hypothetical protein